MRHHRGTSERGKVGQQVWRSGGESEDQGSVNLLRCSDGSNTVSPGATGCVRAQSEIHYLI